MKTVRVLLILGLGVFLSFFYQPITGAQPTSVAKPPTITHAFAVDRGQFHQGYAWKVYIEAEAGDADMARVALDMRQPGAGSYPTDWIIVKPQYKRHLKGYMQWNARSASGSVNEGTMITLNVSIFDKAGKESNPVAFHFTFLSGTKDQPKPPPPFEGNLPRLGYIHVELRSVGGGPE